GRGQNKIKKKRPQSILKQTNHPPPTQKQIKHPTQHPKKKKTHSNKNNKNIIPFRKKKHK
ncbi:hypothetical protein ACQWHU_26240, partial [Salmonella enterica subsp. enterica serovar Infantis]